MFKTFFFSLLGIFLTLLSPFNLLGETSANSLDADAACFFTLSYKDLKSSSFSSVSFSLPADPFLKDSHPKSKENLTNSLLFVSAGITYYFCLTPAATLGTELKPDVFTSALDVCFSFLDQRNIKVLQDSLEVAKVPNVPSTLVSSVPSPPFLFSYRARSSQSSLYLSIVVVPSVKSGLLLMS